MTTVKAGSIDEYIAGCSSSVQEALQTVQAAVKKAAPEAEEAIKYAMPTFTFFGNLVHFAAFKNHIGFYPAPIRSEAFEKELSQYKTGRGSVQFPLSEPIPVELISRIVAYYMQRNLQKGKQQK